MQADWKKRNGFYPWKVQKSNKTRQFSSDKNIFSVTEAGKLELKRWLSDDSMEPKRNPLLMRTFFRGELSPEENIQLHMDMLRRWSETCIARLEKLTKEHPGD